MMQKKGFTLLEVIIAIFILTVGIIGVFALVIQTTSSSSFLSSRLTAAYLAQEGIEIARNIRDGNWLEQRSSPSLSWNDGLLGCASGCEADYDDATLNLYAEQYLKINAGFYNYSSGVDTKFKRKISISQIDSATLEVSVLISWQEKGKNYDTTVVERLYNWYGN